MDINREELDDFEKVAMDFLGSIELCRTHGYLEPALILLYSCIDVLASFDRGPSAKHDRNTFMAWVDKYLLPIPDSDVTSIDIYAARCGLLHSYSPDSDLTAGGKARHIAVAWGTGNDIDLRLIFAGQGLDVVCAVVHADKLVSALQSAVGRFHADYINDPVKKALVIANVRVYSNLPADTVSKAAQVVRDGF
jgi:hypothetical protein